MVSEMRRVDGQSYCGTAGDAADADGGSARFTVVVGVSGGDCGGSGSSGGSGRSRDSGSNGNSGGCGTSEVVLPK